MYTLDLYYSASPLQQELIYMYMHNTPMPYWPCFLSLSPLSLSLSPPLSLSLSNISTFNHIFVVGVQFIISDSRERPATFTCEFLIVYTTW